MPYVSAVVETWPHKKDQGKSGEHETICALLKMSVVYALSHKKYVSF